MAPLNRPMSTASPEPSAAIAENLFAAPADSAERPYVPGDYEAILVPNAKGAMRLAILGMVLSAAGVIGAGIGIAGSGNWTTPLFFALPAQFAALAAAVFASA